MKRRTFFKVAGIGAGAAVATAAGFGAAMYAPVVEFPRASAGAGAGRRALVAYASLRGSTAEVAAEIGKSLAKAGYITDVLPVGEVAGLEGYEKVVVGSAVRIAHWLPEAVDFVQANAPALEKVGAAVFTVCMTLSADTPETREKASGFLQPVRAMMRTGREAFFAGKVDFRNLSLVEQLALRMKGTPEGDYRDWDAIRAFANRIAEGSKSAV